MTGKVMLTASYTGAVIYDSWRVTEIRYSFADTNKSITALFRDGNFSNHCTLKFRIREKNADGSEDQSSEKIVDYITYSPKKVQTLSVKVSFSPLNDLLYADEQYPMSVLNFDNFQPDRTYNIDVTRIENTFHSFIDEAVISGSSVVV